MPGTRLAFYLAETGMRLSLRFVLPLFLALGAFAYAAVPLVDKLTLQWFMRDLDSRASLIARTAQEPLQDLIQTGKRTRMLAFFDRITKDERLFAMGYCPSNAGQPVITSTLPSQIRCSDLERFSGSPGHLLDSATGALLVSVRPLEAAGVPVGNLVVVHDMSFIARRSAETRKYLFLFFVGLGATVALITVVIAQLSWRGWIQGLQALLRGEGLVRPSDGRDPGEVPELRPIASDLRALIRDLEADHRSRDEDQLAWTPETLRAILRADLPGHEVMVVSNREPYIHVRRGDIIALWRPASGLVTAMEPIMRACSGTWIAHGGGSADREVVDEHAHVAVPPELPDATIVSFWHIPWPNPEAFAICPWRDELLDGLLGSSILGFHTQFHCNNFVDTVDRLLEARVDREMFTVSYRGKLTAVKRYP